jgi:8-oxo-dGTP diphosphatase
VTPIEDGASGSAPIDNSSEKHYDVIVLEPEYPQHTVTVDVVLFRLGKPRQVLLIQRRNEPFRGKWALPGGFVDVGEPTRDAARRELYEETGVENHNLSLLGVFDQPGRDPRGPTISVAYFGWAGRALAPRAGDDAAAAAWFDLDALPELAFDHRKIINTAWGAVQDGSGWRVG